MFNVGVMIKWLKQLFCEHDYRSINSPYIHYDDLTLCKKCEKEKEHDDWFYPSGGGGGFPYGGCF